MNQSNWNQRYSRQLIIPEISEEGQKKWRDVFVLIAGEKIALKAAITAFSATGIKNIFVNKESDFSPLPFIKQFPDVHIQVLKYKMDNLPIFSAAIAFLNQRNFNEQIKQISQMKPQSVFLGWTTENSLIIYHLTNYQKSCPCFQCFKTLNTKAFGIGNNIIIQKVLAGLMTNEVLQFLIIGTSPIRNKIWITSLESGVTFKHDVYPTYKCQFQNH